MDLDGVVAGRSAILYASEGSDTYWREPFVRQGFGAAGILIAAAILAGVASFARRRGRLLFGAFTLLVAVPAAMATVLSDEYRFIPGAIVAGLLADLAAQIWPTGRSRLTDGLVAFLVPALFFTTYFLTVAVTTDWLVDPPLARGHRDRRNHRPIPGRARSRVDRPDGALMGYLESLRSLARRAG